MQTILEFATAAVLIVGGFVWIVAYWGSNEILLAMLFFGISTLLTAARFRQ